MRRPHAHEGTRVVVLSGGGLSAASDPPRPSGSFRGCPVREVPRLVTWRRDPELVHAWFDERRAVYAAVLPNPAHEALSRMQHALGSHRCTLVTRNTDGLLQKASAEEVVELRGSMFRLRCDDDPAHPHIGVYGPHARGSTCTVCGAPMRPDITFRDEPLQHLERVEQTVRDCDVLVAVGTAATKSPIARLVRLARDCGARCIEVNPNPSEGPFDEVLAEGAETAIPRLIGRWLDGV